MTTVALSLAMVPAFNQTASADPPARFSYSASAFGTSVMVGSVVQSGQSAPTALGCTATAGLSRSNRATGTNLSPVGTTGAVKTLVESFAAPVRSRGTAITSDVDLLGGLIEADGIRAQSATTRTSSGGFQVSANGTTLTGLRVAGEDVQANAAPNTRINLSGFGFVIVNEQIRRSNGLTVNGLRIVINSSNPLGVLVGSNIIVSQAVSGLSGPVVGVISGSAYGSYATVGSSVLSSPTFKASLPCLGTDGVVKTNSGAGSSIPGVALSGTITNTVKGTVTATTASGEAVSNVQGANVLSGLVTASAIKASAEASSTGSGPVVLSSEGSGFGSLAVEGQSQINADVAPNTRVRIAGVGTLYLNRVLRTETSVQVIMIQLILSSPVDGLDTGTDIRVGVASAGVG